MSLAERVAWGLLAGITIVLVKILVPDRDHVHSLFVAASSPDIAFYVFISAITVLLGIVSGAFSNEPDRIKLLLFCASVPALLSTATGQLREPVGPGPVAAVQARAMTLPSASFIIGSAYAQNNDPLVCTEGGFFEQFSLSAKNYLSGSRSTDEAQYAVIVASTKELEELEEAKKIADRLAKEPGDWQPSVGCRRPENEYYPVMIGPKMTQIEAATRLGQFLETKLLPDEPFLDNYPYRAAVYTPSG